MNLTDLFEKIAHGDVSAVAAALDSHPELLDVRGENGLPISGRDRQVDGGRSVMARAKEDQRSIVARLGFVGHHVYFAVLRQPRFYAPV